MPKYEIGQAVYLVVPQLVDGGKLFITATITSVESKEGETYYTIESEYLAKDSVNRAFKESTLYLTASQAKAAWKVWLDESYKKVCQAFETQKEKQ